MIDQCETAVTYHLEWGCMEDSGEIHPFPTREAAESTAATRYLSVSVGQRGRLRPTALTVVCRGVRVETSAWFEPVIG